MTIPSEPVPFTDPRRTRTASGRPCWLHGGLTHIPDLQIAPGVGGGSLWSIRFMLESDLGTGAYSWASEVGDWGWVQEVLQQWAADPEGTTRTVFHRPVPGDPGMERRPLREGPPAGGTAVRTTASAEDLGL